MLLTAFSLLRVEVKSDILEIINCIDDILENVVMFLQVNTCVTSCFRRRRIDHDQPSATDNIALGCTKTDKAGKCRRSIMIYTARRVLFCMLQEMFPL